MLTSTEQKIHFVGVGGSGMSGIAEILQSIGFHVSGSDTTVGNYTTHLQKIGVLVAFEHNAQNVHGKDLLVVSSAILNSNPEILEATKLNIPILHRSDMLFELMKQKETILIAGTHGKTTTTSIVAHIFEKLGLNPTAVIGGQVSNFKSNAVFGKGKFFIAEADESDGSFLRFIPNIAVITNIDKDHLEYYGDLNGVFNAFKTFVSQMSSSGTVCLCLDDANTAKLIPYIKSNIVTFGRNPKADITVANITTNGFETSFSPVIFQKIYPQVTLNLPGHYNISNALATFAIAHTLGLNIENAGHHLASFAGTLHRYTLIAKIKEHLIIDDYAHNPTKIETVLAGTKESFPDKKIVVVFQPHKYSRLQNQMSEFAKSFASADAVILTPVYAAGENPIEGISSESLAKEIHIYHPKAVELNIKTSENFDEAVELCIQYLNQNNCSNGIVFLVLGAGNISYAGHILKERLQCET